MIMMMVVVEMVVMMMTKTIIKRTHNTGKRKDTIQREHLLNKMTTFLFLHRDPQTQSLKTGR